MSLTHYTHTHTHTRTTTYTRPRAHGDQISCEAKTPHAHARATRAPGEPPPHTRTHTHTHTQPHTDTHTHTSQPTNQLTKHPADRVAYLSHMCALAPKWLGGPLKLGQEYECTQECSDWAHVVLECQETPIASQNSPKAPPAPTKMAPRSRWVLPKNTTFGLVTPKTTPTNVFRHPNACDVTFERTRSFFAVAQGVRLDKEEFTIHSLQSTCAPAAHFNPDRKKRTQLVLHSNGKRALLQG